MRDYQRDKVYVWEQSQPWFTWNSYLTEEQILDATKKLDRNIPYMPVDGRFYEEVKNKKTKIVFSSGRGSSLASKRRILLKREWALNYNVLFHEYSHNLAPTHEHHGENFVSIYCCLLVAYHPQRPTFKQLAASLNEHNVNFKEFDYWWNKLKLSKRIKPFAKCSEEPLPKPITKKRRSAKQKLIQLCEEYDWLEYDDDCGYEYFKCEIWDTRVDEHREEWFDEMTDNSDSWKRAYQYALQLVERDKQYGKTFLVD